MEFPNLKYFAVMISAPFIRINIHDINAEMDAHPSDCTKHAMISHY